MAQKENECPEVNSKTKLGISFKEFVWILSLVIAIGYAYADIKNNMTNIDIRLMDLEQKQELTTKQLDENRETYNQNLQNIFIELQKIRGDLNLKQDRYK